MKSTLPPPAEADWLTRRPIAHRGLHDRARGVIENSIAAARAAIADNYAIECDIQDSADGEAFIFHDHDLARLTGSEGAFCAQRASTIDDLRLSDAKGDAGGDPKGDARIPRLADFLSVIGGQVPLVIEIKSRFDGNPTLMQRCIALLRDYGGPVCIKSFDPQVVAWLRRDAPQIMRGIVADAAGSGPPGGDREGEAGRSARHARAHLLHFGETLPDFVSWHAGDLPHAAPFLCRKLRGMPVLAWTLRSTEQAAHARAHTDQIVFEGFRP